MVSLLHHGAYSDTAHGRAASPLVEMGARARRVTVRGGSAVRRGALEPRRGGSIGHRSGTLRAVGVRKICGRSVEPGRDRSRSPVGRGVPSLSAFADTSGLYALLVRTEERHADVVRAFRTLLGAGRPLWTTSYVIVETVALLQHRFGLPPVNDFEQHIRPVLSVEWVSESLHRRGFDRLLREDRRHLSLVDCVSLECMRSHGLREALALDPHFAAAGYRLLPPPRTS